MSETAYFVSPPEGPGPGVLLLHSWWGLTSFFRRTADRLSDDGYTVLAPDLNFGRTFDDPDAAREHLQEADANRLASLTLSAARLLEDRSAGARLGVVGFSMGASLGLWASVRLPDTIGAVVAFYGVQSADFEGAAASYQIHLAESDPLVDPEEAVVMEATMGMEALDVEVFTYPGTGHWFFESDREAFDRIAAERSWDRTRAFLRGHLV